MKKLLTLALALVALAVFTGVGVAQEKGAEKEPTTTAPVMEKTAEGQEISGQVTKVYPKTNTFTVKGKGFEATISKRGELPDVGAKIRWRITCDNDGCIITLKWRK